MHLLTPMTLAAISVVAATFLKIARQQAAQNRREEAVRKLDEYFRAKVDAERNNTHAYAGDKGRPWKENS